MRLTSEQWHHLALSYHSNPNQGWSQIEKATTIKKSKESYPLSYRAYYPDRKEYPNELFRLHRPPLGLLVSGEKPLPPWSRRVAIVGTRKSTPIGLTQAYLTAQQLIQAEYHVVSGLAYGIDIQAHRACINLDGPGSPIAVLPSHPQDCYPKIHRQEQKQIESCGHIVSEYFHRGSPQKWQFIARNRIIAALSAAVIVIEAPKKSGALHTADMALELGIPVLVLNGPAHQWSYEGSRKLIQEGAIVCDHPKNIVSLLEHHITPRNWNHLKFENQVAQQGILSF